MNIFILYEKIKNYLFNYLFKVYKFLKITAYLKYIYLIFLINHYLLWGLGIGPNPHGDWGLGIGPNPQSP